MIIILYILLWIVCAVVSMGLLNRWFDDAFDDAVDDTGGVAFILMLLGWPLIWLMVGLHKLYKVISG